jgi:hypothetical protein
MYVPRISWRLYPFEEAVPIEITFLQKLACYLFHYSDVRHSTFGPLSSIVICILPSVSSCLESDSKVASTCRRNFLDNSVVSSPPIR